MPKIIDQLFWSQPLACLRACVTQFPGMQRKPSLESSLVTGRVSWISLIDGGQARLSRVSARVRLRLRCLSEPRDRDKDTDMRHVRLSDHDVGDIGSIAADLWQIVAIFVLVHLH